MGMKKNRSRAEAALSASANPSAVPKAGAISPEGVAEHAEFRIWMSHVPDLITTVPLRLPGERDAIVPNRLPPRFMPQLDGGPKHRSWSFLRRPAVLATLLLVRDAGISGFN